MAKYVIYRTPFGIEGTPMSNYNAAIQDANLKQKFSGFDSVYAARDCMIKYSGLTHEDILLVDGDAS